MIFLKFCCWLLQEHAHYGHPPGQLEAYLLSNKKGLQDKSYRQWNHNSVETVWNYITARVLGTVLPSFAVFLLHLHTAENNFLLMSLSNWLVPWKINGWFSILGREESCCISGACLLTCSNLYGAIQPSIHFSTLLFMNFHFCLIIRESSSPTLPSLSPHQ